MILYSLPVETTVIWMHCPFNLSGLLANIMHGQGLAIPGLAGPLFQRSSKYCFSYNEKSIVWLRIGLEYEP